MVDPIIAVAGGGPFADSSRFDSLGNVPYSETIPDHPNIAGPGKNPTDCLKPGGGGVVDSSGSRTTLVGSRVLTHVEVVCASGL